MSEQVLTPLATKLEVIEALARIRNHHQIKGDHYRAKRVEEFVLKTWGVKLE